MQALGPSAVSHASLSVFPAGAAMRSNPRWLSKTTNAERDRGDGAWCADWIDAACKQTADTIAGKVGEPIVCRPFQRDLLGALLARRKDGRRKHRSALVGMPRKNGKSSLASGIALFELLEGPDGGQVLSCAAEKEQARIVFGTAKRMVELDAELSARVTCYRDALDVKATGSVYRVLSAEAYSKEGLNPSLVVFDEVHAQPNRELWDVMAQAQGARVEPLMLGITTAGVMSDTTGNNSLCFDLYLHGRDVGAGIVTDPSFFFCWWEPRDTNTDHRDPKVWADANPGLGDIVASEDFEAVVVKTPEAEFRTKRLNIFTAAQSAWLPFGAWDACAEATTIGDGADVVLGFDGSFNNTAPRWLSCPSRNGRTSTWSLVGNGPRAQATSGRSISTRSRTRSAQRVSDGRCGRLSVTHSGGRARCRSSPRNDFRWSNSRSRRRGWCPRRNASTKRS
jgi:hypothetical protein